MIVRWGSSEEYEGVCFVCEVGARFSSMNKERCGRMRGLRRNAKSMKWLLCRMERVCNQHGMAIWDTWSLDSEGQHLCEVTVWS